MWDTSTLKKTFQLKKLFRELNEKYFDNLLGDCTFEADPYPDRYAPVAANIRPYTKWTGGQTAIIKFNSHIHWNETNIRQVLIHEMIHYYVRTQLKYRGIFSHGIRFQLIKWKINHRYGEHVRTYWHGEKIPELDRKAPQPTPPPGSR